MTTSPAVPSPVPASVDNVVVPVSDGPRYTWADVVARAGPPTPEDLKLFTVRAPPERLRELGAQVASFRIRTDLTRWCGTALDFYAAADLGLQSMVLGYSLGRLRVLVAEGQRLVQLLERSTEAREVQDAELKVGAALVEQKSDMADDLRTQLKVALDAAAEGDAVMEAAVAAAYGRANTAEALAGSLKNLARLAKSWLDTPGHLGGERLRATHFTPQLSVYLDSLGADVEQASLRVRGARTKGSTTQADLDQQDGVCLTMMETMMRVFNAAHAQDGRVPRMVPIATRNVLGTRPVSTKAKPDTILPT